MIFEPFPKIPRLRRDCTITEKIDGTNAQIYIEVLPDDTVVAKGDGWIYTPSATGEWHRMVAGSRSRWLDTSSKGDNFGFAKWVAEHAAELVNLGPGRHFGEWYGAGIQRRYGLTEKRFALFNTDRWGDPTVRPLPACCHVVPVLYRGPFDDDSVEMTLMDLRAKGSYAAAPHGFGDPEGIIVWMHASRTMHKVTLEKDDAPKGQG